MDNISVVKSKAFHPERIIQFGEGGFLRAFVDWMIDKMNKQGVFDGSVVIVQPLAKGMCKTLDEQNGLYTLILRGLEDGKVINQSDVIECISRCVDPYAEYRTYLDLAKNPDFRFIVSNTTEAGIEYVESDKLTDAPPKSFPAKLTTLLYERFKAGLDGFIILPCELIDNNGSKLKEIVLKYADQWKLGNDFCNWINNNNKFNNTLVDRIVTGFPRDEINELQAKAGYQDNMMNTGEIFHLWVIEGDKAQADELPFHKTGLNVIWTDDQQPYRTRKVRILNGAHTALVPKAMLAGFDTVRSCIDDANMNKYLSDCIYNEIIPTLDLPEQELKDFADNVFERFANPYTNHYLASIALNSVSKFKVRVLPSILEYIKRFGKQPENLISSFGALIKFYKTDMANDDAGIIDFMRKSTTAEILASTDLWDQDLSFLLEGVTKYAD